MRLIVVVEGQTEEAFVKDVLAPHLEGHLVYTSVTIVGKRIAQQRGHQGRGGGRFKHWKNDVSRILNDQSPDLRVTTLFDLYGLPPDFPGLGVHGCVTDTARRCSDLEAELANVFDDRRFIPYLQRHEFEALVLAALPSLRLLLDAEDDLAGLGRLETVVAIVAPEDINDGVETAPSKRLLASVPGFSKTLHGPLATHDTGISRLREQCPRFNVWVGTLEALGLAR